MIYLWDGGARYVSWQMYMWKSEDSLLKHFSPHHVDSGSQTSVASLGSKHLYWRTILPVFKNDLNQKMWDLEKNKHQISEYRCHVGFPF